MYETKKQHPIARTKFVRRLLTHFLGAVIVLGVSLVFGIWGYMFF
jgi:hypothetical protein